jgi:hypothetical protein
MHHRANHVVKGTTRGRNVQGASSRSSYSWSSVPDRCCTSSTMVRLLIAYDSCNCILRTGRILFAHNTIKAMGTFAVSRFRCITSTCFQTRYIKLFFPACHLKSNGRSRSKFRRYAHPTSPSSRRTIPPLHHLNYPIQ